MCSSDLVENGVVASLFTPADMMQARNALGLSTEPLFVGYFGSINAGRGPLLIDACRIARKKSPSLQLLLAGNVDGVDLREPWVTYLGDRPQREIPALINACNVVAIPYADTPFNRMCGACKIAEYLACAKPVVATRVSDHALMFADAPSSLCDPTPESMAEALLRQLSGGVCAAFPRHLTWSAIGAKLQDSLQSLSGS